mmetsp:Transcript_23315/g.17745  ORF Transcript_23315/g.17745 Transcript_23315/m.17745 type:complete len:84 (+) Transcript_23315:695-946(+)|eukprot:CAMPEP_0202964616 /NCGR_PEP_ID=MMETSP1396-20130829/8698_1 /ASSEMBLY_ACC=CAM_ASM_000872 /TAXON_ID= /ORGANISM="Pseudokeronopsis sp., Strain Brazil" /LENGTH=83 /DNA_ID=CAMNT_0049686849 /DNA_START=675 /DNA_END=926 /DNA_ORIENTATION=+
MTTIENGKIVMHPDWSGLTILNSDFTSLFNGEDGIQSTLVQGNSLPVYVELINQNVVKTFVTFEVLPDDKDYWMAHGADGVLV